MLTIAINTLFCVAGILSVAVIAHSLVEARAAYARLMHEGEVLRAGLALQASALEMSLRPSPALAPRRAVATRRPAGMRPQLLPSPLQACAA